MKGGRAGAVFLASALPLFMSGWVDAQTCDPSVSRLLAVLEGEWRVEASRRVAPGRFEAGEGTARVESAMEGCGLVDSRRLHYAAHVRESVSVVSAFRDAAELAVADSEHGSFTVSRGEIEGDRMEFEWSRDMG